MKLLAPIISFLILLLCLSGTLYSQGKYTVKPLLPEILQPYPNLRDFTISEECDEAYLTAQSPLGELSVIIKLKKEDNQWSDPQLVAFSGKFMDLEPFLAPDGLRLFFASNRPLDQDSEETKDFDIWYVERKKPESEWSSPINLGKPVNSKHNEFFPSVAGNNNLYFTSDPSDSKGMDDIYFSAWQHDHYATPVSLSDSINSEGYEFNAFIAPDESYLLFSGYNREDGFGSGDMYISYRRKGTYWTKAKNLGDGINSDKMDYCPFVDLQGKTLFFTSKRSMLEPPTNKISSIEEFLFIINAYENGLSRIYQVPFAQIIEHE